MSRASRNRRYRVRVSPAPETVEVVAVSEEAAVDRAVRLVRFRQHWAIDEIETEVCTADDENPRPPRNRAA